mgnify:CR=1 FL=1
MIPLKQALSLLDEAARPLETEKVPLSESLGRFLAVPVTSPVDIPPFSKSAMDGFAVRSRDVTAPDAVLRVTEVVGAGTVPRRSVEPGTAVQIMTGAPVPDGADAVIRVEYADQQDGTVRFHNEEGSSNIIARGENARAGDELLTPRRVRAHDVGVAASIGLGELEVYRVPTLGILSTGDELLEPGQAPAPGTIYNSNAYQIAAQATAAGFGPHYYGIAADTADSLRDSLRPALEENRVIVLSGGVSKGEYDYVPDVLAELGVQTVFHRVAVKPGRPTFFGTRERDGHRQYVFGLPGNPVSTYVMFLLFVERLLYRMCALEPPLAGRAVTIRETIKKRDAERTEFIPVAITNGTATPVRYGGSSHLNALSTADALLEVPVGTTEITEGATVHVRSI